MENKEHKIFGNWLKEQRLKKGLTQVELAKKIGVSEITIYNAERGHPCSIKVRAGVAKLFKVKSEIVYQLYNN